MSVCLSFDLRKLVSPFQQEDDMGWESNLFSENFLPSVSEVRT